MKLQFLRLKCKMELKPGNIIFHLALPDRSFSGNAGSRIHLLSAAQAVHIGKDLRDCFVKTFRDAVSNFHR